MHYPPSLLGFIHSCWRRWSCLGESSPHPILQVNFSFIIITSASISSNLQCSSNARCPAHQCKTSPASTMQAITNLPFWAYALASCVTFVFHPPVGNSHICELDSSSSSGRPKVSVPRTRGGRRGYRWIMKRGNEVAAYMYLLYSHSTSSSLSFLSCFIIDTLFPLNPIALSPSAQHPQPKNLEHHAHPSSTNRCQGRPGEGRGDVAVLACKSRAERPSRLFGNSFAETTGHRTDGTQIVCPDLTDDHYRSSPRCGKADHLQSRPAARSRTMRRSRSNAWTGRAGRSRTTIAPTTFEMSTSPECTTLLGNHAAEFERDTHYTLLTITLDPSRSSPPSPATS